MKKAIRILLGVVIAIVGVILTFLGIFSLGPLPLPAFSTGVLGYYCGCFRNHLWFNLFVPIK